MIQLVSAAGREILLRFSQEISHLVVKIKTCINGLDHFFLGHQSHRLGLLISHKLESINKLIGENVVRTKLNNHGTGLTL